jgi:hypothetical protein
MLLYVQNMYLENLLKKHVLGKMEMLNRSCIYIERFYNFLTSHRW